jgi:alpha-tubulin suppressor-like RCC1 family protein
MHSAATSAPTTSSSRSPANAPWAALGLLLASTGLGLALTADEAAAQPAALGRPASAASSLQPGQALYSFGNNLFGTLGHGDAVSRATPTLVTALAHAGPLVQIVAAGNHAAALGQDGRVWTWGSGVAGVAGQGAALAGGGAGAAVAGTCTQPAQVEALAGRRIIHLALSSSHACAVELLPDGSTQVWAWGSKALGVASAPADGDNGTINRTRANRGKIDARSTGQRDNSTPVLAALPQLVPRLRHENVVAVACGKEHSLALTSDGRVFSFGSDRDGALGQGDLEPRAEPALIESLLEHGPVVCVAAGTGSSLFVTAQGTLLACGANDRGQAGTASTQRRYASPVVVPLRDVTAVSTSAFHACALDVQGVVHSFGLNNEGQCGVGNRNLEHRQPVPVQGALASQRVRSVSAGFGHTAAVTSDGRLFTWGRGREGQHGRGDQVRARSGTTDTLGREHFQRLPHPSSLAPF